MAARSPSTSRSATSTAPSARCSVTRSPRYGRAGLPQDTIDINFTGSAGQSFGAFVPSGITMRLIGDANDYVGKGLSGGRIIVHPPRDARSAPRRTSIAGNVISTVPPAERPSCAAASASVSVCATRVPRGQSKAVGDHGCEYMTGGRAVVLGPTGRNFAAGMSGGIAYVYDPDGAFAEKVNLRDGRPGTAD